MRVAKINVDKNIEVLNSLVKNNLSLSQEEKVSIEETTEVVQILLERLHRKRLGRASTEKKSGGKKENEKKKDREPRNQLPSKRYPNAPVIEKNLDFEKAPECPCCQGKMVDSGMKEAVEQLGVIPKKYIIYRYWKHKYTCQGCHGAIKTVPTPPRIVPNSSYHDDLVMDVALSKYCDLLPIERYVAMAARNGLEGLPGQSLIGITHHLANFLECVYERLKEEILGARVIHADETPHKMLEGGGDKKSWFLWGFSCETSCFFEIQNSRSSEVPISFLRESKAEFLVSDVYSGYHKAVADTNTYREEHGLSLLCSAYCNVHARRKFVEQFNSLKAEEERSKLEEGTLTADVDVFLYCYREIYKLEGEAREGERDRTEARAAMSPYFEKMKTKCKELEASNSPKSGIGQAISYFWNHYKELTCCLEDPAIPLDNNAQERLLRPPVVGRKTWYGNHSKRGARTTAVLFSIVGACHLNKVNPREYLPHTVECLHRGEPPPTPHEYAQNCKNGRSPPDTG